MPRVTQLGYQKQWELKVPGLGKAGEGLAEEPWGHHRRLRRTMSSQVRPELLNACLHLVTSFILTPRLLLPAVLIRIPLSPCYLTLFCSLHPNWGAPLPTTQMSKGALTRSPGYLVFAVCLEARCCPLLWPEK